MSKTGDAAKQVRLEPDVHSLLVEIKRNCQWPVSISTLANYAARKGMNFTKRTFNKVKK